MFQKDFGTPIGHTPKEKLYFLHIRKLGSNFLKKPQWSNKKCYFTEWKFGRVPLFWDLTAGLSYVPEKLWDTYWTHPERKLYFLYIRKLGSNFLKKPQWSNKNCYFTEWRFDRVPLFWDLTAGLSYVPERLWDTYWTYPQRKLYFLYIRKLGSNFLKKPQWSNKNCYFTEWKFGRVPLFWDLTAGLSYVPERLWDTYLTHPKKENFTFYI